MSFGEIEVSGEERVALMINLHEFRGSIENQIGWLRGAGSDEQRENDIPLLERLKERDNTENLQKNFLISDIVEMLVSLEKEKLINIWELCKYIED